MNWRAEWSGVALVTRVVVVVARFRCRNRCLSSLILTPSRDRVYTATTLSLPVCLDPIGAFIIVAACSFGVRVKISATSANIHVFLGLWATYLYFVPRRPTWTLGAPPGATCVVTQPLSASRGPTLVKFSVAPDKSTWL